MSGFDAVCYALAFLVTCGGLAVLAVIYKSW